MAIRGSDGARAAAGSQLVAGMGLCGLLGGAFARKGGEGSLELTPDAADRDHEHALAAAGEVEEFVGRGDLVDAEAVA